MSTFAVEYCKNWDGGKQEFNTAKQAILDIFPDATVIERRVDKYPVVVKIYTEDGEVIFTVDQRNLFSKYATKRKESIDQIHKILRELDA